MLHAIILMHLIFCIYFLHVLNRIDYEKILSSCVDSNGRCDWPEKESETMVLNKLYHMIQSHDTLGNRVYNLIVQSINKTPESKICEYVISKLEKSNVEANTLEQLTNVIPKCIIAGKLIYAKHIVKFEAIKSIVQELEAENIKDEVVPTITTSKFSFNKLTNDVVSVVKNYCTITDLLRLSYLNRFWYAKIMKPILATKCESFQTFKLTSSKSRNYDNLYSSQWILTNLKTLHIHVSEDTLEKYSIPKFKQKTIQYLDSYKFHCIDYLPILKALQIRGDDTPISDTCGRSWLIQKEKQKCPLIFTVINFIYLYRGLFIPRSKSLLFESCKLTHETITHFIRNQETEWVGIQNCWVVGPYSYSKASPIADILKYKPNKKLNFFYSSAWNKLHLLLNSDSLYDKYVSDFQLVADYTDINKNTGKVLSLLANVQNYNEPKSVKMLFQYDGPVWDRKDRWIIDFEQLDAFVWGFIQDYFESIAADANIKSFVIGLIRTCGKYKTGVCFDLKQIKNADEQNKYFVAWNNVLYIAERHESADKWENEFHKIEQSIPTNF